MRRAHGGGALEIFLNGEERVEGVFVGDVADEGAEEIEVGVEWGVVHEDGSLGGFEVTCEDAEETAFA